MACEILRYFRMDASFVYVAAISFHRWEYVSLRALTRIVRSSDRNLRILMRMLRRRAVRRRRRATVMKTMTMTMMPKLFEIHLSTKIRWLALVSQHTCFTSKACPRYQSNLQGWLYRVTGHRGVQKFCLKDDHCSAALSVQNLVLQWTDQTPKSANHTLFLEVLRFTMGNSHEEQEGSNQRH